MADKNGTQWIVLEGRVSQHVLELLEFSHTDSAQAEVT
jgi:hypothetical protein